MIYLGFIWLLICLIQTHKVADSVTSCSDISNNTND